MTLRVGFSRPRSKWAIGSKIIRWFDGADFSHAFIRWTSRSLERDLVYQAGHGMVHFISGARFDADVETIREYEIAVSDEHYVAIVQKCVDLAGVRYGYLQLLGMAFERITGLRSPFRDGSRTYVCSELVGEVLKADLDLEYVGPKKLEEFVASMPEATRIQ